MVAWPVPQVYGMAGYSKVHNAIAFSIGRVSDITMQLAVVRAMVNVQTLGIRQSGHNVKSTIAGSNRFPNLVVTICWSVERNVVILVAIAAYVKEKGGFSVRVNFVSAGAYGWVSNGKRRNGHHHSHNAGDCKGEKTLAEFLHNRFLQSERNLYRVCFGADMFSICAPMLGTLDVDGGSLKQLHHTTKFSHSPRFGSISRVPCSKRRVLPKKAGSHATAYSPA